MSDQDNIQPGSVDDADDLALLAHQIESAFQTEQYQEVADLIEQEPAGAWFSLPPTRLFEILQVVLEHVAIEGPVLRAGAAFLHSREAGRFDQRDHLATVDFDNPREVLILTLLRMFDCRAHGKITEALEHARHIKDQLGSIQPFTDTSNGAVLLYAVQNGITGMLAGDFSFALTCFTRAQMHPPVTKFAFLTRDALAKSALIHASFGNATTAMSLLKRANKVPRTSSWAEAHIQAHTDFADVLLTASDPDEALTKLESISLHDIGELWPFYVLAVYRILEAAGYHDELEHRLEMFETMPFPKIDGNGFSGSIIPLKRAMLAMRAGPGSGAQEYLDRADPDLPYTQLFQAAAHIYAGRPQQAIQVALALRAETRGFRFMEIRRLAILSAAQFLANETTACLETLERASSLPRGLQPHETLLFSPETRTLGTQKVADWPRNVKGPSAFLAGLPEPGRFLTDREIEIVQYLAKGLTRAQLAEAMFISINTLKTHLTSIYRKLNVTTAADAILGAQGRGLL